MIWKLAGDTYFAPGNTVALKTKSSANCGSLNEMLEESIWGLGSLDNGDKVKQ